MFGDKGQEVWPSPYQIIMVLFEESHFAVKCWKQTHSSRELLVLTFILGDLWTEAAYCPFLSYSFNTLCFSNKHLRHVIWQLQVSIWGDELYLNLQLFQRDYMIIVSLFGHGSCKVWPCRDFPEKIIFESMLSSTEFCNMSKNAPMGTPELNF